MLHLNHRSIVFCIFIFLSFSHACSARFFMISQEKKLQISTDKGIQWEPYDLLYPTEDIDFFDLHYDNQDQVLYLLGYHRVENILVLFTSNDMQTFFPEKIPSTVLREPEKEYIQFMKIRTTDKELHLFGRFNKKGPWYDHVDHSKKQSIHLMSRKHDEQKKFLVSSEWVEATTAHPLFRILGYYSPYTLLNIFSTAHYSNIDYIYLISDPEARGRYPFIASSTQKAQLFGYQTSSQRYHNVSKIKIHEHRRYPMTIPHPPADVDTPFNEEASHGASSTTKIKIQKHRRYPMTIPHSSVDVDILFGEVSDGVFATNGVKINYLNPNPNYPNFGTMLFTENHNRLFFLTKKLSDSKRQATLAYGLNLLTLTETTTLDESLGIENLTRETAVEALEKNGFYRFVKASHNNYLFFLSYCTLAGNLISLTLESEDGGQSWNTLKPAQPLPATVREIIKLPDPIEKVQFFTGDDR